MLARVHSFAPNSTKAVSAVTASMRAYRTSETSARDLISTIWNVLDQNMDYTASIVSGFVDLLEDEDKKKALLSAWNTFKIEVRNVSFIRRTPCDCTLCAMLHASNMRSFLNWFPQPRVLTTLA